LQNIDKKSQFFNVGTANPLKILTLGQLSDRPGVATGCLRCTLLPGRRELLRGGQVRDKSPEGISSFGCSGHA
jgi:hypothetical protein